MKRSCLKRNPLKSHVLPAYIPSVCTQTTELSRTAVITILYFFLTKVVQPILLRAARRFGAIRNESRSVRERRLFGLALSYLHDTLSAVMAGIQSVLPVYTLEYVYIYASPVNYKR